MPGAFPGAVPAAVPEAGPESSLGGLRIFIDSRSEESMEMTTVAIMGEYVRATSDRWWWRCEFVVIRRRPCERGTWMFSEITTRVIPDTVKRSHQPS